MKNGMVIISHFDDAAPVKEEPGYAALINRLFVIYSPGGGSNA
jgi:hypothetical protein